MDLVESLVNTSLSRDKFLNIINSHDEFLLVVDFEGNIILHNESIDKFMLNMQLVQPKGWKALFPVDFIDMSAVKDNVDEKVLTKSIGLILKMVSTLQR